MCILHIPGESPHVPHQREPAGGPRERRWAPWERQGTWEGGSVPGRAQDKGAKDKEARGAGDAVWEGKGARPASCSGTARGGREARPGRCPGPRAARPAVPAGIALIMWNALYTAEKAIIRWSLLAEACYFAVQFLGECPRAGWDEEEEGVKTLRGGKWGSTVGRAVVEHVPCQLLASFLPHGIGSALSCSLNITL